MNTNASEMSAESPRTQGNASGELVMHPATGEVFDVGLLSEEPPEILADLLLALREHQGKIRQAEKLVNDALSQYMAIRKRRKWVVGEYEIEQGTRNSRVWDGDELDATLVRLVDEGVVTPQEVADVVEHVTKVHGREALSLMSRLRGDAAAAIEDCFTWERKPTGSLSVTRSIELVPELDE